MSVQQSDPMIHNHRATALTMLAIAGDDGLTWAELAEQLGVHHGVASGLLSRLHKAEIVGRLTTKRNKRFVYVLASHVNGRETQSQGKQPGDRLSPQERARVERLRTIIDPRRTLPLVQVPNWRVAELIAILDRVAPR